MATVIIAALLGSCSNTTDAYCDDLGKRSDLKSLVSALNRKDLAEAKTEARSFGELADRAPEAIRTDMQSLAQSVLDIIDLLEKDLKQASVSSGPAYSTSEVEQLREQLNRRFDDLDTRSARVNRWASQECGLKLS